MSTAGRVATDELRRVIDAVMGLAESVDDADRVERIRLLEQLKAVTAAVQMSEAVAFAASQQRAQSLLGVPAAQQGRGVAAQIALARRISPWAAQRWLGASRIVISELPATYAELRHGRTSEWRAMIVARETALLSREDRAVVDEEIAPRMAALGDRRVEREARTIAYRLDPHAAVRRARRAANDRCVTIRPAPDLMCRLSALVPLVQGVGAYAALSKHADSLIGVGTQGGNDDGTLRGRGQVMADTLIERITGRASADDVDVEISLVMTAATLVGGDEPAVVGDYGPIPASAARDLALGRRDDFGRAGGQGRRWLRRVITSPDGCRMITMESSRREFTTGQRAFLRVRDQVCRTPWCGAPIRHADHVRAYADGGATSIENGQGLCEACNYARQAAGWSAATGAEGTIITRTPTGHTYESHPPDPPGADPPNAAAA